MAEPYFDPSSTEDVSLLRDSVQKHAELSRVAKRAERDCIDWYKQDSDRSIPNGATRVATLDTRTVFVALDGYAEDAADADGYDTDRAQWTGFADDFRRAIANVLEHRLRYFERKPDVTSETRGDRSEKRKAHGIDPLWPAHWNRNLDIYDLREPLYSF